MLSATTDCKGPRRPRRDRYPARPAVDRTAKSTAVGAGSLFARRMPWAIYFSGPISISLKAARMGRLRRTGRDRWRANGCLSSQPKIRAAGSEG